ncbi:MAG: DNA polymerase III subunit gamma/tau [Acidimicrobiales bacterium]|nr:DNA polymerase III subunit gamma/tau [Acidimicrobiales bacterium]
MASYQSLYRRYRPQRFDEVLGQDHVTKALRNAVRDGRVGHAYLFSGPRGTGKTSTARILAKVLNCAAPVDGEPCGQCENCVAVAEGRVTDWLLEQDAASKSKVDDMRDLLERVPLGTSGTRKVIILDEVHMLSQGAENALLKTLEEPPAHVVFVLATTDPQKVRPTIRSRTQHFEFRLLPSEVLADHVRHVIADAGLQLESETVDQAVDHVLRSGGGSARDTLSALDQVAALGEVVDEAQPVDAVLDALCERDAGQVLVAVADAVASGRDPRTLGENVIAALRDAFLSEMGAGDVHLAPAERERAARVGERLGPAGLTRALDVLGEALTELSRKPDPRIVVEVALVRITQPAVDRTLEAVLDRLDRLERGLPTGGSAGGPDQGPGASGGSARARGSSPASAGGAPTRGGAASGGGHGATTSPAGSAGSAGSGGPGAAAARDALSTARTPRPADAPEASASAPGAGRPTLGAVVRGRTATSGAAGEAVADDAPTGPSAGARPSRTANRSPAAGTADPSGGATRRGAATRTGDAAAPVTAGAPDDAAAGDSTTPAGASPGDLPALTELEAAWTGGVLASLPVKIRSKWRGGRWAPPGDGTLRFTVPNSWHQSACDTFRREVEQALADHFGRALAVVVVVDGDGGGDAPPGDPVAASTAAGPASVVSGHDDGDETIDPAELRDADDVATNGVDMLLHEFGGGHVLEEDP